ncbi:hypothetical protein LDENG_00285880 [Lucifuga dentata]|nr:hypothetical protein LDENG_00285880 [Lucifuga dentata]
MQTRRGWEPAVVMHKRDEPRSYATQSPAGKMFRRNRCHLRKINPSLCRSADPDEQSEVVFHQTPRSADLPPLNPLVSADDSQVHHTRSSRVVRLLVRYKDYVMDT